MTVYRTRVVYPALEAGFAKGQICPERASTSPGHSEKEQRDYHEIAGTLINRERKMTSNLLAKAVAAALISIGLPNILSASEPSFQQGGTITFSGGVRMPSFAVNAVRHEPARARMATATATRAAVATAVFRGVQGMPLGATVDLYYVDSSMTRPQQASLHGVSATVFDDSGKAVRDTRADGRYTIGQNGGQLKVMDGNPGGFGRPRGIIVMPSYD